MKTLGVIANCRKERAAVVLRKLAVEAEALGLTLYASGDTAEMLEDVADASFEVAFRDVDAVVALGGDGTMLSAVRQLHNLDKPLMGVNMGSLGFMTSVTEQDLGAALQALRDETYIVSERSLLESVVSYRGGTETHCALNDVVVTTGASSRVISLDVTVDGDLVTTYACDGLIVSSPTGSTGHSLSAGGPILSPEASAFVISPICPHTLSSRPLVVPDTSEIRITVAAPSGDANLIVDGQVGLTLKMGAAVSVQRCSRNVRFLHLPGYDYFAVLRQKLRWHGSSVI